MPSRLNEHDQLRSQGLVGAIRNAGSRWSRRFEDAAPLQASLAVGCWGGARGQSLFLGCWCWGCWGSSLFLADGIGGLGELGVKACFSTETATEALRRYSQICRCCSFLRIDCALDRADRRDDSLSDASGRKGRYRTGSDRKLRVQTSPFSGRSEMQVRVRLEPEIRRCSTTPGEPRRRSQQRSMAV
jgi:hypothetical protein